MVRDPIWLKFHASKIVCMSLLNASLKRIKKLKHHFRHLKAANSVISRQIWPKFELIKVLMHVLITCKYQNDRIENNQEIVEIHFFHYISMGVFLRCSRAGNSRVSGSIWPKFELFLDIMHVLVNYQFKIDWINSKREKVATPIFWTLRGS